MNTSSVPQKKGPQYNASSARGTEADTEYQYEKGDNGSHGEGGPIRQQDENTPPEERVP